MLDGTTDATTRTTIRELLAALARVAPFELAESWDNVGLLIGEPDAVVSGVACCLDLTENVVKKALKRGCNAIVCHHPPLFHKLSRIRTDEPVGRLIALCLKHDLYVLAAHTNLDSAQGGLNDEMARLVGITQTRPLVPKQGHPGCGMGRIGTVEPVRVRDFLERAAKSLKLSEARFVGDENRVVSKVALCTGAGADFIPDAVDQGADLYLTGDVTYHDAMQARERGLCLADLSHYGTEWPAAPLLARRLKQEFLKKSIELSVFPIPADGDPSKGIIFHALLDNWPKA